MSPTEPLVRRADERDIASIYGFGREHIPPHYTPILGAAAANEQVSQWWNADHLGAAVAAGLVIVAERDEQLVGVGQRGQWNADQVIYKLYVHPLHRGSGLGPRLIDALIGQLPADADRIFLEHFAGNARAAAFYEREGFRVHRIEPSPTGDPASAVVWRVRRLG